MKLAELDFSAVPVIDLYRTFIMLCRDSVLGAEHSCGIKYVSEAHVLTYESTEFFPVVLFIMLDNLTLFRSSFFLVF